MVGPVIGGTINSYLGTAALAIIGIIIFKIKAAKSTAAVASQIKVQNVS